VNCAAGKDRTGILCALTHHILGVEEADLRADYELTNTAVNVDEFLPQAAAFFNEQVGKIYEPEVFRPFLGVRLRYLDTAFNVIHDKHGTVDAYLADVLGVDDVAQERLRARLLET
jgi:protein tyrosine/serine phosphatase